MIDALTQMADDARRAFGLGDARSRFIRHGENVTFRLDLGDSSFLLRLHGPHHTSPDWIESEAAWLSSLAENFVVPTLITIDGGHSVEVDHPTIGTRRASVARWVEGVEGWDTIEAGEDAADLFRDAGRLMARLHAHADAWRRPAGFERVVWDARTLYEHPMNVPPTDETLHLVPTDLRRRLAEQSAWARAGYERAGEVGLVHADLHPGNLLRRPDGSLAAIDFDDCGFAPKLYDLAACLGVAEDDPHEWQTWHDALLAGYAEDAPLPDLTAWPQVLATRGLSMVLWIAGQSVTRPERLPVLKRYAPQVLDFIDTLRT